MSRTARRVVQCWKMFDPARWLCVIVLLLAPAARAHDGWLVVRGAAWCAVERDALAARIDAAVAGVRNPALGVDVNLAQAEPGRAVVQVSLGGRLLGAKTLEIGACDEALDAVSAVVALALSSQTVAPAAGEQTEGEGRASRIDGDVPHARAWRLLAGLGVDAGTLARPTLLVMGGSALALGRAELRVLGRYGIPSTTEEEGTARERLRLDFGAAALDACWGLDRARWLSACGGFEVSIARSVSTREATGEARSQQKRLEPAFGPLAGLTLVLRDVPGQPQLELSAQLPLAGRASAPGFRAALGGGLLF